MNEWMRKEWQASSMNFMVLPYKGPQTGWPNLEMWSLAVWRPEVWDHDVGRTSLPLVTLGEHLSSPAPGSQLVIVISLGFSGHHSHVCLLCVAFPPKCVSLSSFLFPLKNTGLSPTLILQDLFGTTSAVTLFAYKATREVPGSGTSVYFGGETDFHLQHAYMHADTRPSTRKGTLNRWVLVHSQKQGNPYRTGRGNTLEKPHLAEGRRGRGRWGLRLGMAEKAVFGTQSPCKLGALGWYIVQIL